MCENGDKLLVIKKYIIKLVKIKYLFLVSKNTIWFISAICYLMMSASDKTQ